MKTLEINNHTHKIFSGVCASLGDFLKIDASIVRFVFIISGFLSYLTFFFYIIATIIIPNSDEEISAKNTPSKHIFHVSVTLLLLLIIMLFYYFNIPLFTFSVKLSLLVSLFIQLFLVLSVITYFNYNSNENNALLKKSNNKIISGVLSGIAEQQKTDVSIIRLLFILLLTFFNVNSIFLLATYFFLSVTLKNSASSDNLD